MKLQRIREKLASLHGVLAMSPKLLHGERMMSAEEIFKKPLPAPPDDEALVEAVRYAQQICLAVRRTDYAGASILAARACKELNEE